MKFEPRIPEEGINVSRGHPLLDAAKLAVLVGGLAALAVVVLALLADRLAVLVPPEVEVRAFARLLPDLRESMAPAERDLAEAVTPVLHRLAARLETRFEAHLLVVRNPVANAFAVPGGVIGVTTGLLEGARSENELAFVLGHELGHFMNRDHLRRLGRELAVQLLFAWLGGGGVDASAHELVGAAGRVTSLAFDRGQESAADAVGLELLHAAYGHVGGATHFFERVNRSGSGSARRFAAYFESHPAGPERIETIEILARERGWSLEGELLPLALPRGGE